MRKAEQDKNLTETRNMIGARLGFAPAEAYKLLRTNIMFSFTEEKTGKKCRTIGVTSALRGEGKSLTAMNLAYFLAKMDKQVLLLECDMRLPSLAKRLHLPATPGLSNILTGVGAEDICACKVTANNNLDVIVAGDTPPNPPELFGSKRMQQVLETLRERYDYVILDLPPAGLVTDALVLSNDMDGVIVVVRQDFSDRASLDETLRQLSFVNARVLGFVFNCARESYYGYGKRYGRYYKKSYRYYGKYYKE